MQEKRLARKPWPQDVEAKILTQSRRICAFCFYFENDGSVKIRGQIAHIDRNPSNDELENGAYLCKEHHDEYDMVSKQSKRLTPGELKEACGSVIEFLQSGGFPSSKKRLSRGAKQLKRRGISLDVYERRLPIYRAAIAFIRYVAQDLQPAYPEIIKFGHDTEEALFLFDEEIAKYLRKLSNQAVRLHAVGKMREAAATRDIGRPFESLLEEETSLATWFTEQYEVTREVFAPFLRLE